MLDKHPNFLPRWTKLTIEAIKNGEVGSSRVHNFVHMKDNTLEFVDMNSCYVGEAYCFDFDNSEGGKCRDCDGVWPYPPEWMYKHKDNFLMWKDMFYEHMLNNHYDRVKDL